MEKMVAHLVPALLCHDPSYLHTFLSSCRALASTQQVLDLLFTRFGCVLPYCEEDGGPLHQLTVAMSSLLGTWLHEHPEDFYQPPDFPCLKMVLAYVQLNMAGSTLEQGALLLLEQLEQLEATQEPEGEAGRLGAGLWAAGPGRPAPWSCSCESLQSETWGVSKAWPSAEHTSRSMKAPACSGSPASSRSSSPPCRAAEPQAPALPGAQDKSKAPPSSRL
ncbi:ral guanine nucleotide dissociation stimulator-like [Erinaceus europaeus]|uniref:Ral guanine nucleotide dissociation stimulator-like n=1 Tax=Erinaceus europaeus TaxID=9365 RepID=A0ABM3VRN1_ERIEU|nr:ral guanine nucleotide dissociation stimulator-like [Erinaceus europaeus]